MERAGRTNISCMAEFTPHHFFKKLWRGTKEFLYKSTLVFRIKLNIKSGGGFNSRRRFTSP
jgi:hypothetical protein